MTEKYQKITVGGLLVKDNKVLVVRRSSAEPYLTGYYELPGGKVDFGDHPKDTLEREFMEEVNLKIIALHPYRIFTYISEKGNRHTVELVYFVKLDDEVDNIKLSDEHDDFKWVSVDEIDTLQISDEIKTNIKAGLKEIEQGTLS
ncbi:MAG: NUDIX hydrolase [Nanoarchaeota archaeon]|nr:NUDIX hydrolase [Nanoarchaeota archaeon]